jgi:hypothetical protein
VHAGALLHVRGRQTVKANQTKQGILNAQSN